MRLGTVEILIILLIVVVLFGVGRVGQLGGELGRAIREFRRGLRDGEGTQQDVEDSAGKPEDENFRQP